MSGSDRLPDYPLSSDVARRLRSALEAGDDEALQEVVCTRVRPVDAVIELANDDWMKDPWAPLPPGVLVGLWTLEYKRELTTPLCITAARGHEACVGHLLSRGANPDTRPGGCGPLHEACLGGHTACAELLLRHRADPNLLSAEGLAPLHLCCTAASLGCAQALLEHGASVHCAGGASQDTPLHVAAQHGLDEHVRLYLDRGARVDAKNGRGETALSAACGAALRPNEHERCLRLCALLLQRGAAPDARDEDERSPLHKACSQGCLDLAHLLLRHGADATALDYGGASPLGHVLQTAARAPQAAPERIVQALLNHGSPTVWPDAFPKITKRESFDREDCENKGKLQIEREPHSAEDMRVSPRGPGGAFQLLPAAPPARVLEGGHPRGGVSGAPAFLPGPLRRGSQPALPAAPLPLRHPQVLWQEVLSPGTPAALARVPEKLPPSGARGCSALKPGASGLGPVPALPWRGERPKERWHPQVPPGDAVVPSTLLPLRAASEGGACAHRRTVSDRAFARTWS